MAWTIEFAPAAARDLERVDSTVRKRILKFLYTRVARLDDPRGIGEALRGQRLGEFWKYRVGDYRILCQIEDAKICVVVARVGHRREVYD
jgi:mRNA interferase RelE/StbE